MTETTKPDPRTVGCAAGCGKKVTPEEAEQLPWVYLEITKRYRCQECTAQLLAARNL